MRGQRAGWRNPVSAADGLGLGWVGCQMFVATRGIWRGRSSQPAAGCEKKIIKAWHSGGSSLLGTASQCSAQS